MKLLSLLLLIHYFAHATVVITLAARDGLVITADGMTVWKAGDPSNPGNTTPSRPKVSICGRFICGMAGINPIDVSNKKGRKIEYEFQHWVSTIGKSKQAASPREFSKLIKKQARITFRDMDFFFRTDPYWTNQRSPEKFMVFQVIGYPASLPTRFEY